MKYSNNQHSLLFVFIILPTHCLNEILTCVPRALSRLMTFDLSNRNLVGV